MKSMLYVAIAVNCTTSARYFLSEFHPLVMRFIKYYFDREHSGSTVLLKVDGE